MIESMYNDDHNTKIATAKWANPQDVENKYPYKQGNFWLGRLPIPNEPPIGYNDDRHICLVSGNRGGKGTTSIVNNLALWPGSCVVIDPKGENALVTAARRGQGSEYIAADSMGQAVYVLAPMSKAAEIPEQYRACFNPLDALDPEDDESIDEAGMLADAIVVSGNSDDPFWEESARNLIKGLILYVLTSKVFAHEERNLITVRRLITHGDFKEVEYLGDKYKGNNPHKLLFANMRENKCFGHIISGVGETFLHMADKMFSSVLQTANTNTEFLDSPGMQKCLAKSDFKISDLKTSSTGVSLYLTLPQRYMNTHFRWLRMMTTLTITEMEKTKGQPKCGHRVLMVLDEFAGLKRMKIIEDAIAQMAGHGLKMMYILQSLSQLKAVYKDNWETFLGNAGLKLFFAIEDQFTRKWISDFVGETEIIRNTKTESSQEGFSESTAEGSQTGWNSNTGSSKSKGINKGAAFSPEWLFYNKTGRNTGTNQGTSTNTGTGKSGGASETRTEGTTRGTTLGSNETIHKRPLITPDEVGTLFSRIDDKHHPAYPGLALALISGQHPIAVQKCNYFEDIRFEGLFDKHPDHDYIPPSKSLYFEKETKKKYKDIAQFRVNKRQSVESKIKEIKNNLGWRYKFGKIFPALLIFIITPALSLYIAVIMDTLWAGGISFLILIPTLGFLVTKILDLGKLDDIQNLEEELIKMEHHMYWERLENPNK